MRALEETLRAHTLGEQNQKFVTGGWWDMWAKLRQLESALTDHKFDIEKLKGAARNPWQQDLQALLMDPVHPPTVQSVVDFFYDRGMFKS